MPVGNRRQIFQTIILIKLLVQTYWWLSHKAWCLSAITKTENLCTHFCNVFTLPSYSYSSEFLRHSYDTNCIISQQKKLPRIAADIYLHEIVPHFATIQINEPWYRIKAGVVPVISLWYRHKLNRFTAILELAKVALPDEKIRKFSGQWISDGFSSGNFIVFIKLYSWSPCLFGLDVAEFVCECVFKWLPVWF